MRLWGMFGLCLGLTACGDADRAGRNTAQATSELTVTLPPAPPSEAAVAEAAPEAGFETVAVAPATVPPVVPPKAKAPTQVEQPADEPAEVEVTVGPASVEPTAQAAVETGVEAAAGGGEPAAAVTATVPAVRLTGASAWAGYLRKSGFPCARIASATPIERASGQGLRYYRVECDGGATYQATDKRGHLYFRRWRG